MNRAQQLIESVVNGKDVVDTLKEFTEAVNESGDGREQFINAYIEAALWSGTDLSSGDENSSYEDTFEDEGYTPDDISPELMSHIKDNCYSFFNMMKQQIGTNYEQAGHDFWLTRNGHGAGFWDRPEVYGEKEAKLLTATSKDFGEENWYSDDDQIHLG